MKEDLLKLILRYYANSRDFNGVYFDGSKPAELREAATELVSEGLVQVMTDEDYPNPHIRPWPSKRTIDQQVASVESLTPGGYGVCLYPTELALKKHRPTKRYPGQPYRLAMAKGKGTLELAYFSFDVLEQYRNDPRFSFTFSDFGATVSIGDEAYLDADEPEHDKTGMQDIGFAYDLSKYDKADPESPVLRRVCAFYGDLARLTAIHQQRWKTYEVPSDGLHPHPVWWSQQMGHWADGAGPFERLFFELTCLNELHERAFGNELFKVTERPDDFGWILRPSQQEWDRFVQDLDKLVSENIRHDALDLPRVPRLDDEGKNIGSLNRLATLLTTVGIADTDAKDLLKPLRNVRQARQRPAHSLRKNVTDKTFVHKQIALLEDVTASLSALRHFWQTHPRNREWEPKYGESDHVYRM